MTVHKRQESTNDGAGMLTKILARELGSYNIRVMATFMLLFLISR